MIRDWFARLPGEAKSASLAAASVFSMVALLLFINWVATLVSAWTRIDHAEPRIGRLLGYEAMADELRGASTLTSELLNKVVYLDGTDASQTGATLQQVLRSFASDAGLSVVGSQFVREIDTDIAVPDGFEVLGVDLTMSGPPLGLDTFLRDVYTFEPTLKVISLELQQRRGSRTPAGVQQTEDINIKAKVAALMVSKS